MLTALRRSSVIWATCSSERERLPISLEASSIEIDPIEETVVETCDDGLPPRLVEIGLPHGHRLRSERSDRPSFNLKLGAPPLPGNEAEGFVHRRVEARARLTGIDAEAERPIKRKIVKIPATSTLKPTLHHA